jgi:hypothetical protein
VSDFFYSKLKKQLFIVFFAEVRFTEENKTAIEAEQGKSPFGPELEPIDRGYIGRDVKINHSKTKKSPENAHSCGSSGCKSSH